ncbi:MAG: ABC transporter permease [Bacteroidales bacterium]|nr:ABC transporter permease [Bacteroidales bacterium]
MFRHYLKSAFRDIFRKGFYSIVIIFSLAIGLTCVNYILPFSISELSVDGFHKKKDRIFRLLADDPFLPGSKMSYVLKDAPLYLKDNYPEIEDYCETFNEKIKKVTIGQDSYFDKTYALAVSNSFPDIFSYRFHEGNPEHALDSKDKVVITRKLAEKYFGSKPAMGQEITIYFNRDTISFSVSGVMENVSYRSHLKPDILVPCENFQYQGSRVYLLLNPFTDVQKLEGKLSRDREKIPIMHDGNPGSYSLQKLKDIYFDKTNKTVIENSRSKSYIYITAAIGLVIMIISFLNYINLLSAQLLDRQRKSGINRILGGKSINLLSQILIELGILIFVSLDVSILLTRLLFPYFNQLTGSSIQASILFSPDVLLCYLGIFTVIGLITMVHASIFLKRQQLNDWLSGSDAPVIRQRKIPALLIFQFVISVILIISVLTAARQLDFIHKKDIGIDQRVIELRVPYSHRSQIKVIKERILQRPVILSASICAASPVLEHAMILLHFDKNDNTRTYSPCVFFGDEDYIRVLDIKLLKGRNFITGSDQLQSKCIINQSLADMFEMNDPVGQKLPGAENEIIGLTEDFHFQSLENEVAPGYIALSSDGGNILVKPDPENYQDGINHVKAVWNDLIPDYPFEFMTIEDQFIKTHADSDRFYRFLMTFLMISLLITCAGLLAVTIYSGRTRTKEIGIRKVHGAKTEEIIVLLSADYLKLLLISLAIAFPVSYYMMSKWLQNFAYRTGLAWWIFVITIAAIFVLVFITIFWQTWKTARGNPVEALRYE